MGDGVGEAREDQRAGGRAGVQAHVADPQPGQ